MTDTTIDTLEMTFPCKPEFVGVARLVMLGVASRMKFSFDDVEDIKLAVAEACTVAVDWAEKNKKNNSNIELKTITDDDKIIIEINDNSGPRNEPNENDTINEEDLGSLLIGILMDEVDVKSNDNGTNVRMVKYVGKSESE
ncbi:MAG: ATP-binding protein [Armatimonadota bacterium]